MLTKAVAQALLTYTMSCFALLQMLCDEVEKLIKDLVGNEKYIGLHGTNYVLEKTMVG